MVNYYTLQLEVLKDQLKILSRTNSPKIPILKQAIQELQDHINVIKADYQPYYWVGSGEEHF